MNDTNEKTNIPNKPIRKVAQRWPSVRSFLTTASITATLGGWAILTLQDPSTMVVESSTAAVTTSSAATLMELPPIPTVVPVPTLDISAATVKEQPTEPAAGADAALRSVIVPTLAPTATIVATSTVAATPTEVVAPTIVGPTPAATTQSSRARSR